MFSDACDLTDRTDQRKKWHWCEVYAHGCSCSKLGAGQTTSIALNN